MNHHNDHATFRVSCKAVLLNPDATKVLLVRYAPGVYGLPGGHIDEGEAPDDAIARELSEELGLNDVALRRGSFMKHEDGKIVLFYVGSITESTSLCADTDELEAGEWALIEDIQSGNIDLGSYAAFTMKTAAGFSADYAIMPPPKQTSLP